MIGDKDLISIQQARILAENAADAQTRLSAMPQESLDTVVEAMAEAAAAEAQSLAVMSHEETGCGVWQDKMAKNLFACRRVIQSVRGMRCVGRLPQSADAAQHVFEVGVPVGVIAALSPCTNPVSTTICNVLAAVKAGNSIVVCPHQHAVECTSRVVAAMSAAGQAHGLPEGSVTCLTMVADSGIEELMRHRLVALVLVTGRDSMLEAARHSGKPFIYGGMGNGPAFIEATADICKAVDDILASKSFDNGLAPSAEQCVIVDGKIEPQARRAFEANGACFINEAQAQALSETMFHPNGRRNRAMLGQSATVLAEKAGIAVPQATRVLLVERRYVDPADPFIRELLAPVLAYYVEPDWRHACEKCLELLLREGHAQTMTIHSQDEEIIQQFALKKPVARMLVNTPAAFGGMGLTTDLFPSMTQGSGLAGHGFSSDNISPMNLIYRRKVGYGVRGFSFREQQNDQADPVSDALRRVLRKALNELNR